MKRFLQIALPILTVLWIFFIFSNSMENANTSEKKSGSVTTVIVQTIKKVTKKDVSPVRTESVIRKIAHFTEFGIFAALLTLSVWLNHSTAGVDIFAILFCGLFAAVTDEFLQTFSKGRSGNVRDVLIDFAGVLTGLGVSWLFTSLLSKRKTK